MRAVHTNPGSYGEGMKSGTESILIQSFNLSSTQTLKNLKRIGNYQLMTAVPPTKETLFCYGSIVYGSLVTLLAGTQTRCDPYIVTGPHNGSCDNGVSHKVAALSRT